MTDGNNETSAAGVPMIQTAFMSVWNWDARPFPEFPQWASVWGDAGDWPAGNWLGGKGPFLAPLVPSDPPAPGPYATFPALPTLGWSVKFCADLFDRRGAARVGPGGARRQDMSRPLWEIELNYDLLAHGVARHELQTDPRLLRRVPRRERVVLFRAADASPVSAQALGTGDGTTTTFAFTVSIGGCGDRRRRTSARSPNVYLNGVLQSSGYTVNATALAPSVTFATAPASGVAVTADFHWYFLCRFDDDSEDVEEFMATLYALQSLRLKTCAGNSPRGRRGGCCMTTPPSLPTSRRARLVAAQEAGLFDARRLARLRPRGARRA